MPTEDAGRKGAPEPKSFEDALGALEDIVHKLEAGGMSLDESTGLYERGVGLARFCSERVAAAEMRINQVRTAYGQQMRMMEEAEAQVDMDGNGDRDGD